MKKKKSTKTKKLNKMNRELMRETIINTFREWFDKTASQLLDVSRGTSGKIKKI